MDVTAHINNLYNTTFWSLVHGGQTESQAHETLKGTMSSDKNEILYKQFQINYDKLDAIFRKGTALAWDDRPVKDDTKPKAKLRTLHVDIIGIAFWKQGDSRSMTAPPTEDSIEAKQEVWQQQSRIIDTNGLGRSALDK